MAKLEIRVGLLILDLLAGDEKLASCLVSALNELRHGRRNAEATRFRDVYFYDACGLRLWVAMNPSATVAEITGYAELPMEKPDEPRDGAPVRQ